MILGAYARSTRGRNMEYSTVNSRVDVSTGIMAISK